MSHPILMYLNMTPADLPHLKPFKPYTCSKKQHKTWSPEPLQQPLHPQTKTKRRWLIRNLQSRVSSPVGEKNVHRPPFSCLWAAHRRWGPWGVSLGAKACFGHPKTCVKTSKRQLLLVVVCFGISIFYGVWRKPNTSDVFWSLNWIICSSFCYKKLSEASELPFQAPWNVAMAHISGNQIVGLRSEATKPFRTWDSHHDLREIVKLAWIRCIVPILKATRKALECKNCRSPQIKPWRSENVHLIANRNTRTRTKTTSTHQRNPEMTFFHQGLASNANIPPAAWPNRPSGRCAGSHKINCDQLVGRIKCLRTRMWWVKMLGMLTLERLCGAQWGLSRFSPTPQMTSSDFYQRLFPFTANLQTRRPPAGLSKCPALAPVHKPWQSKETAT